MRFLLIPTFLALGVTANGQVTLVANTSNNNGLTAGMPGLFFDFTAGANPLTVTELSTASNRAPGDLFDIEVFTRSGTGLGGPVAAGPGSDPAGWTSLGIATATQGATMNGTSLPIDIPDILVPAGQTVGVALVYLGGGSRYFGTGVSTPQVFSDADLTLTTGNSRSMPFTPMGSFFESRGLHGEVTYILGAGSLGNNFCTAVANSTGSAATMSAGGSATAADNNVTLTASDLPLNQFGIFVTSMSQGFIPGAGGTSNGNLCLSGSLGRFTQPSQIVNSGSSGQFSLSIDTTAVPQGAGFVAVLAGETWNFQAWYRDPVGVGSNFTDGLQIDFQ